MRRNQQFSIDALLRTTNRREMRSNCGTKFILARMHAAFEATTALLRRQAA